MTVVMLRLCLSPCVPRACRWWWRSVLVPATAGVYVLACGFHQFVLRQSVDGVTDMSALGNAAGVSVCVALCAIAVGHLAALWFARRVHAVAAEAANSA